jgi:hypothetical protein
MTSVRMSRGTFPFYLLVLVVAVAFFEYGGLVAGKGSLLVTLVFWTTLLQGAIAAAAGRFRTPGGSPYCAGKSWPPIRCC